MQKAAKNLKSGEIIILNNKLMKVEGNPSLVQPGKGGSFGERTAMRAITRRLAIVCAACVAPPLEDAHARVKGAAEMDLEFYARGLLGRQTSPAPAPRAPAVAPSFVRRGGHTVCKSSHVYRTGTGTVQGYM